MWARYYFFIFSSFKTFVTQLVVGSLRLVGHSSQTMPYLSSFLRFISTYYDFFLFKNLLSFLLSIFIIIIIIYSPIFLSLLHHPNSWPRYLIRSLVDLASKIHGGIWVRFNPTILLLAAEQCYCTDDSFQANGTHS